MTNGPGKNRRRFTVLDRDTPSKEAKPVKQLSLINAQVPMIKDEALRKKSLANLPRCDRGLAVLREIRCRHPRDHLMTTDAECHSISVMEMTELATADDAFPAPDPAQPFFRRLKVRVTSGGEVVEVANIPATPRGRDLLLKLMKEYPDCDFLTTDYGWHRFSEIMRPSIDDLNEM